MRKCRMVEFNVHEYYYDGSHMITRGGTLAFAGFSFKDDPATLLEWGEKSCSAGFRIAVACAVRRAARDGYLS